MIPRNKGSLTAAMGVLMGLAALSGAGIMKSATAESPTARADGWRPGGASAPSDRLPTGATSTPDRAVRRQLSAFKRAQRRYPKTRTGSHKQNRRRLLAGR